MVVTNSVDGDSRVRKIARSVAAAGWDVTVVGLAKGAERERGELGAATVLRVPVRMTASDYARTHPPRGPLGLLGYGSAELARLRHERQKVRRADLELDLRYLRGVRGNLRRGQLVWTDRARGYWVEARRRLYQRGDAAALAGRGPIRTRAALGRAGARIGLAPDPLRTQPRLADFEIGYGPVLDELAPDVIHAHDVDTLGIAVRAAARARRAGRSVSVVYDAHEYVAGIRRADPTWLPAMLGQERRYLPHVDAMVTVNAELAGILADSYRLASPPAVVTNAPESAGGPDAPVAGIREVLGLADDVPLIVYTGGVAPLRGLATVVDALPLLDGVHFAVVVGARHRYVTELIDRAARLGVGERLHVLPYVPAEQVVAFTASASIGVIPLLHTPAHQIAISTKLYEFMHARLPIMVSDMRAQAALVRQLGCGEVFSAGDPAALAEASRAILAEPTRYTKAYDAPEVLARNSWEAQVPVLLDVYQKLIDRQEGTR
jgi:glycosyltransferase involved in cell wall biosynthesis